MLADIAFPSPNPADYTVAGQACPWYQEQKATGSVIDCAFPSTTVIILVAVGILAMLIMRRT